MQLQGRMTGYSMDRPWRGWGKMYQGVLQMLQVCWLGGRSCGWSARSWWSGLSKFVIIRAESMVGMGVRMMGREGLVFVVDEL